MHPQRFQERKFNLFLHFLFEVACIKINIDLVLAFKTNSFITGNIQEYVKSSCTQISQVILD